MENEFYTGDFEQLIKEKADQFRMYPSKRVWHSIYNNLHPSRRWPSAVMSLLLITSLSFIGYLNTADNSIKHQATNFTLLKIPNDITNTQITETKKPYFSYPKREQPPLTAYTHAFADVITNETDFYTYTIVKSNRPIYINTAINIVDVTRHAEPSPLKDNGKEDIIQSVNTYIKSNKIFADMAVANTNISKTTAKNSQADRFDNAEPKNGFTATASVKPIAEKALITNEDNPVLIKIANEDKKAMVNISSAVSNKTALTNEEKAWIENYALQNRSVKNKWKNRVAFQIYATPAVNYRKLTTKSKGSTTAFANADINNVISQKPGFGIEAGAGLTYAFAKRLQLKAGLQFNYTNYNIDADQTNHPIITTILLNDPVTGYSYSAARTSTTSNVYNSTALQPVTLHNRTYQISIPVGLAYKLSSEKNADWFAGLSAQPTYVFGGNAHLISSDLKSYVSDPSSISSWNLNLGFETYMNFKLGSYNLQVGPQVRYQVYSTYRKDVALIEKPYAVGLKFGFTKGF